jgi:hypothetical protein
MEAIFKTFIYRIVLVMIRIPRYHFSNFSRQSGFPPRLGGMIPGIVFLGKLEIYLIFIPILWCFDGTLGLAPADLPLGSAIHSAVPAGTTTIRFCVSFHPVKEKGRNIPSGELNSIAASTKNKYLCTHHA